MLEKHAYLVMAHNEFEVLHELIRAIDDERNDIFIHIDARVKNQPEFRTAYSKLYILENRQKTNWGDVSLVKTELVLFRAAYEKGYKYYHLISGTHYPLKTQNEIHKLFDKCNEVSVVQPMPFDIPSVRMKIGKYHFFFQSERVPLVGYLAHVMWLLILKCQWVLGIERKISDINQKHSEWCSLSHDAVRSLLDKEKVICKRFRWTFCSDEYLIGIALSDQRKIESEKLLFVDISVAHSECLTERDYDALIKSDCIFARKFTKESLHLIERIKESQKEKKR